MPPIATVKYIAIDFYSTGRLAKQTIGNFAEYIQSLRGTASVLQS